MSLESLSIETRDELALLAHQLSENPTTRKELLRLTKKIKPDMIIPELDLEQYTSDEIVKANAKIERLENDLRERDAKEELKFRRNNLLEKGLASSKEDIDAIEKLMLDKQISNHETAADYYQRMKQMDPPTPLNYSVSPLEKFDLKPFFQNPKRAGQEEARRAIDDFRNSQKFGTRAIGI